MRILLSKITTAALVLVILWLSRSAFIIAAQKAGVTKVLHDVRAKLQTLTQERETLEKDIASLRSSSYLAREARLKLNVKAIGEKVAFIYRDAAGEQPASASFQGGSDTLEKIKNWLYNMLRH